jgi:hypothetical protein
VIDRLRGRLGLAADAVLVAAIAIASSQLALSYITQTDARTLIDWELTPAVMSACGHGFVAAGGVNAARVDFLLRRRRSITCGEFAWGGAPATLPPIASANRYSIYGTALALRLGGLSWTTVDWYVSGLFGASMAFFYALFRTAVGRALAVAGVIGVALSTLPEVSVLRDFIKLPIFAALWLATARVVRSGFQRGPRAALVPMIVGGVLLGLGTGLRMDTLVFLPVFVALNLLVLPGWDKPALRDKLIGAGAFVLAFGIVGGPIVRTLGGGSNSAHVILLGQMRPFDLRLGVASAPYDAGSHYSDGYVYTMTVAHHQMRGARTTPTLATAEYDAAGMRLLRTLAIHAPADVGTRMIGATMQVFRYLFDWRIREQAADMPIVARSAFLSGVAKWRSRVLSVAEGREFVIAVLVLVLASAVSWRLTVAAMLLVLYFCGYSMLQFSRRHAFHLDVIPVFMLLLAIQLPLWLARDYLRAHREGRHRLVLRAYGRALGRGAVAVLAVVTAIAALMFAARAYQQRRMTAVVDATLAGPWVEMKVAETPLAPLITVEGAPIPVWADIYNPEPDTWRSAILLAIDAAGLPQDEAGGTAIQPLYFMVELNGTCGAAELMIAPVYTSATRTFDHDYSRLFRVPARADRPSRLLLAAYVHTGTPWNRFEGFAVPAAQRGCVGAIRRAVDPSGLPLPVLSIALGPDWREQPLYQALLSTPAVTMTGTPVGPPPAN